MIRESRFAALSETAFIVSIRKGDVLCCERVEAISELGSVAISLLRDRACFGGQGFFFALLKFEEGYPVREGLEMARDCPEVKALPVSELRVVI